MTTIAVDVMGGDHGPKVTIPAIVEVAKRYPDVDFTLVGDESQIVDVLGAPALEQPSKFRVVHASEIVEMDEAPAKAMRFKKNSSMRISIDLVKNNEADACVSAGNTGALMTMARFVLKTISGISRPALCTCLPSMNGRSYVLDLGANVDSPSDVLFQFGMMGSVLIECVEGLTTPSVGLLNIGVEETKGNDTIKAAAELFKESALNYIGYVEADDIFMGDTDLIVCDGFVGNIALKSSEGVAQMIMAALKQEFARSAGSKLAALAAKSVLNSLKDRLDHRKYNGASLLGLRGPVVKSHGGMDAFGFAHAVEVAIEEANANLVERIDQAMSEAI